ncbi:MAG TPA: putative Ig domain-containing protein, partial [Verrucomicrobiae bacterium]
NGTLSANLNNGYVPATGSTFDVLTYSSVSGLFTNFLPPFAVAMQTNYGATKLTLTVLNVRPLLNTIADQNLNELTTMGVTATATDMDASQSLTYALVSGPGGLNVSSAGAISWMPSEAQGPSTNLVVLQVTDNGTPPLSATNTFTVVVNEVNVAPVLTVPANTNINELATLTVTNTATDSDIPANPLTFSLVSPLTGMTINATNGVFTWTPTEAQGPSTNTITVVVTDTNAFAVNAKSLSTTNTFTVVVNEVNLAPVLGALSDAAVNPGQTVSFTATATDADIPANTLTYSLVSPPTGATINSASGLFNWRLPLALANTTNTVQVQVTDFNPFAVNSQHLSDTKSFKVIVNPLAPVVLTPTSSANGQFKFQVNGTTGPDYIIASSTNRAVWSDIFTNLSPSMPFQFTNTVTLTNRFFRARLSP